MTMIAQSPPHPLSAQPHPCHRLKILGSDLVWWCPEASASLSLFWAFWQTFCWRLHACSSTGYTCHSDFSSISPTRCDIPFLHIDNTDARSRVLEHLPHLQIPMSSTYLTGFVSVLLGQENYLPGHTKCHFPELSIWHLTSTDRGVPHKVHGLSWLMTSFDDFGIFSRT